MKASTVRVILANHRRPLRQCYMYQICIKRVIVEWQPISDIQLAEGTSQVFIGQIRLLPAKLGLEFFKGLASIELSAIENVLINPFPNGNSELTPCRRGAQSVPYLSQNHCFNPLDEDQPVPRVGRPIHQIACERIVRLGLSSPQIKLLAHSILILR
jgi:hypothetical protein